MPGICTSAIKHEVLETQSEFKNSVADVNVRALNPKVSTRSFVASQTMTSSSTIAMRGASAIPCSTILAQRWSSGRAQVHDQGRVLINKKAGDLANRLLLPAGFAPSALAAVPWPAVKI